MAPKTSVFKNATWIGNLTAVFVSVLFCCLVGEVLLRATRSAGYYDVHHVFMTDGIDRLVHRKSTIPGLSYELKANTNHNTQGVQIRTNSYGMRDDELLATPSRIPLLRIAVVGDSATFGYGINEEDNYSSVLERALRQLAMPKDHMVEVLNFGVTGYSSKDEALVIRHKVLGLKPALIIIGYALNDPEIDPIQPLHSYFKPRQWWHSIYLLRQVDRARERIREYWYGGGDYVKYPHAFPPKWASVVEAFSDIRSITKEKGIYVLLAILPEVKQLSEKPYPYIGVNQQVADLAMANSFGIIKLSEHIIGTPEELRVSEGDYHPNEKAHLQIGTILADEVKRSILPYISNPPRLVTDQEENIVSPKFLARFCPTQFGGQRENGAK